MQTKKQAIGYVVYVLLKWGVSLVDVKHITEEIERQEEDAALFDNSETYEMLMSYGKPYIKKVYAHHFDDDGSPRDIGAMMKWAFNDYTSEAAGDFYDEFLQFTNGSMKFTHYF